MVLNSLGRWSKQIVTKCDSFGSTVQMTYDGHTQFKTFYGGFMALFIKFVVVMYAGLLSFRIYQKSDTDKSASAMVKDLSYDKQKHYIGRSTFAFAIRLTGPSPHFLLDTSYFRFTVSNVKYIRGANSVYDKTVTPVEMELCGDKFPFVSKDIYEKVNLSTYL